jgi:hypothetical protein
MELEQIYVAISRDDGGVSVMGFLTVGRGSVLPSHAQWIDDQQGWWRREPNDAAIFEEISRSMTVGPQPVSWARINKEDIPKDRSFRNAFTFVDGKFGHDMVKARALHKERLRRKRNEKLQQLDDDWMKAAGQKKQAQADAIEAARQTLRDVPATLDAAIEAAATPLELKAIWPEGLDKPDVYKE